MSKTNLEVAKECGTHIEQMNCTTMVEFTQSELDAYTSRICAEKDAEIAQLRLQLEFSSKLNGSKALAGLSEELSEANARIAMKAEKWRNTAIELREEANRIRQTIKAATGAEERCNVRAEIYDKCSNELSTSPESLNKWEAEKLEPLRKNAKEFERDWLDVCDGNLKLKRQVAMQYRFIEDHQEADNSSDEYPSKCIACGIAYGRHTLDCELVSILSDTQSTVESYEREVKEKAKIEFATWLCIQTDVQSAAMQYVSNAVHAANKK